MKKYLVMAAIAAVAIVSITLTGKSMYESRVAKNDNFLLKNVEALTRDEDGMTITTCLGLWGKCSLADGSESKAPLVEIKK